MYASTIAIALLTQLGAAALPEIQITKQSQYGGASPTASRLVRRGGVVGMSTSENFQVGPGGAYFTTLIIGTGNNPQQLQIGTGASDTFVLSTNFCNHAPGKCGGSSFDLSKSDTYTQVLASPAFNTTYSDGSVVFGPFARDTISIGDLVVSNFEFAVAEGYTGGPTLSTGFLGLGYSVFEALDSTKQYPNLPGVLKDSGAINSRLFSIYLDEESDSGSVLFGGLDQSKYTGQLVTLDFVPDVGTGSVITEFTVNLSAITTTSSSSVTQTIFTNDSSASVPSQQKGAVLPVVLCVGCSTIGIPSIYYSALVSSAFSFISRTDNTCSCDHRKDNTTLQLEFGGRFSVTVPSRDLIAPLYNSSTNKPQTYANGTAQCLFLVYPSSDYVIGEAALKTMYMVFDLDNAQVSLAQAAINSTTASQIHTVAAGPNGVASAANRVQTASANTYSIPTAASANAVFSVSTLSSSSSSSSAAVRTTSTNSLSGTSVSIASATPSSGVAGDFRLGTGKEGFAVAAVVFAAALV